MPIPSNPRKKGKKKEANPDKQLGGSGGSGVAKGRTMQISDQQRVFINVLLETGNREEAAKAAGVEDDKAAGAAVRWLNHPLVKAEYSRRIQQQNSRADFKTDELLRQLQIGAFLDYRGWFKPDVRNTGGWLIAKEHYDELPPDIARIIESAECVYEYDAEGNPVETGMYRVYLIDRKTMIQLCARAMLGDKMDTNKNITQINWHQMVMVNGQRPVVDTVEERIRGLKQLVDTAAPDKPGQMPVPNPDAHPIVILQPPTAQPSEIQLVPDAAEQLAQSANDILREQAEALLRGE